MNRYVAIAAAWLAGLVAAAWWLSQPQWFDRHDATILDVGPGNPSTRGRATGTPLDVRYEYRANDRAYRGGATFHIGSTEAARQFARQHPVGSRIEVEVYRHAPWLSGYNSPPGDWMRTFITYAVLAWLVTVLPPALLRWIVVRRRRR